MFSENKVLYIILVLVLLNMYFTINIWMHEGDTRDIAMLDGNDKVKSEYGNLIENGEINPDRVPSSLNACTYADIEFGLGILSDYNIEDNVQECQAIREYAGAKSPFYHRILGWFLK